MKIEVDTNQRQMRIVDGGQETVLPLYSTRAFEVLSDLWLKVSWNEKYSYTFTWLGRPIIQLPEDVLRVQEVLFTVKPDVVVETGIAHGGSLFLAATLCKVLGRGRVIGVDIEIRAQSRRAIEEHPLANYVTLVEGDSVAPEVVAQVKALVQPNERVLVILDSGHTKQHVASELDAYHGLVSVGSYIVATDGIMKDLSSVPRGRPEWTWDNPWVAATEFIARHPEFVMERPRWLFNESSLSASITHWPGAYLRRVR